MVSRILRKIRAKGQKLSGRTDQRQETNSLIDAGKEDLTRTEPQMQPAAEDSKKLVVVGRESVFSQEIIGYALEMAERMSYEIIALNTAPLSCETFELFSSSRTQICKDFEELSQKSVQTFQKAAREKGIPFTHIVKFSEPYEVLKALKHEIGEFEFVVSEMETEADGAGIEKNKPERRQICVYSIM